ncbi:putative membrane protein [Halobacteroides halobius DSM 5150]|uniref:Putative membrane protein n=1 Tax=Halobacteroides halobius (strain ATCC 35273 / DSM 5150 / MD-1) TaxID=748449 RepID=L0K7H8_HALHC|nr:YhjD/YihY/BrkB family envelope integrity protein [Halobacteroides halobius]AGB40284.1 putative membrane protein [Halobacteroides halobius DSM 5150]
MVKELEESNWMTFIKLVYQKSKRVDIFVNAMSLVYTTLLSIIPLLIFSFYILTLFNFFGQMSILIDQLKHVILNHLATGTGQTVLNYLQQQIENIDINQLGAISFISLGMVVIFLLARVERTFNRIWGVEKHRDLFKRFVSFWTFITLGTFLVTLSLSLALAVGNIYFASVSLSDTIFLQFLSMIAYFLVFFIAYYLIPNTEVEVLAAIVGGVSSGILFYLAKNLYTIYTTHVVTYNQIYGSLAAAPLFLVWLYLIWMIALLGAVISYVFQHRNNLYYFTDVEDITLGIRILLPLAIMIILHKNFIKEGETGVIIKELIDRINVPSAVIEDELERLKEEGLVVLTRDGKYIPACSTPELPLEQICEVSLLKEGLDIKHIFNDQEVWGIYNAIHQQLESDFRDLTVGDLLKGGPR